MAGPGTTTTTGSRDPITIDFETTVHIDGAIEVAFHGPLPSFSKLTVEDIAVFLRFHGEIPDDRAEWHHNFTPIEPWFSAHIYREVQGWSIKQTADQLAKERDLPQMLGFFDEGPVKGDPGDPPSYTQLRDIWEETFTARHRGAVKVIADRLVEYCRSNNIPAPADVFRPDDDVEVEEIDEDNSTIRELTIEKTSDVWEHIRPMVLEHWYLKRHHNWQIPEHQFFDAHAALASESDDVFPESGLGNTLAKGLVDQVHYPSTHRRELSRLGVAEMRAMHRSVVSDLIAEARREGELVGKLTVAIDQTKGHPWTGHIERNEDGSNAEKWRLGYTNDNDTRVQYYHQWASIQVVGHDIPLVLDAVPVHRGLTKGEIVEDLLGSAQELLDDVELVLMDGGFDSGASKNAVEFHDAWYVNRKSRQPVDKERMREMWSEDDDELETVRIVEEENRIGMSNRKTVYVPKVAVDDDDEDEEEESELRQEMLKDFTEISPDDGENPLDAEPDDDSRPMKSLLSDIREEEEKAKSDDEEDFDPSEMYVAFETNDPLAAKKPGRGEDEISEREQQHAAARLVRKYGSRWGIENGFKKRGHFLPRSASPNPVLRFVGFIFAATLYNAWRLVDILVKLSVTDDPAYVPLVTASRFLSVLEGMLGPKPPPG